LYRLLKCKTKRSNLHSYCNRGTSKSRYYGVFWWLLWLGYRVK